jgi:hypothetical protein
MKIIRSLGVQNQILDVFVQDASNTSGAGLANVQGSSLSYSWWHDTQNGASTGVASTAGQMGTYSTSAWVQVSSSNALGWYQLGAPNGVFAAGNSAVMHLYGAFNMAPLPLEIDLGATVSTQALNYGVNVTSIAGSPPVTSAAGILQTSTQALSSAIFTGYTSSGPSNITQILGSAPVTSAAGVLNVSTQAIDKTGYSLIGAYDLAKTAAQDGDAMSLTVAERVAIAGVVLSTTQAESFRASSQAGNVVQLCYEILANVTEFTNSGTTRALNSMTSHAVSGLQYQYNNSTAPSAITRIA